MLSGYRAFESVDLHSPLPSRLVTNTPSSRTLKLALCSFIETLDTNIQTLSFSALPSSSLFFLKKLCSLAILYFLFSSSCSLVFILLSPAFILLLNHTASRTTFFSVIRILIIPLVPIDTESFVLQNYLISRYSSLLFSTTRGSYFFSFFSC